MKIFEKLRNKFNRFAEGAPYDKLVDKITDSIKKGTKKNLKQACAYVLQMNAIHQENYEEADLIKRKIEKKR